MAGARIATAARVKALAAGSAALEIRRKLARQGVRKAKRAVAVIASAFVVIALAGCSGHTKPATNVTSTSATLHAAVTWSSTSEYGVTWFEYSSNGGQTWTQTPQIPWGDRRIKCRTGVPDDRGVHLTQTATGLTPGTHYVYRLATIWCNATKPVYVDSTGTVNGTTYSSFDTPGLVARDVASQAGIGRDVSTHGENCVFDYDRDGVMDLFLSVHDAEPWQLFKGKVDGTFVETNVGTFPSGPFHDRHGCATGDFNGDARPDIYVSLGTCQGTCTRPKELWIQTADGTFVDRAAQFGIDDPGGRGRQPITLNANGDQWPDLFTGQAPGVDYPSPNRLWLNQGGIGFVNPPGLPTEEIGNGCVTAGDFDRDGYDELVVCGGGGQLFPTVFRVYDNSGRSWSDATAAVGLPTWARGDAELADLNGDGWLDLVTVFPTGLEVRANSSGRFPGTTYFLNLTAGRDVAIGDADGDGDQDIYVVQGTNATVPDLLLLNRGSGASYESFSGLPQVTTGEGDTAQAIPNWKGTNRAAFLINNGRAYPEPGPRQLIELVDQ
jgi:FG-GAP-like repeat